MSFGERLVYAREQRGYSQKAFADLLEITPTRLNYWEKDKREPDVLMIWNIISKLEISGDWLISGEGNMEKAPTEQVSESDFQKQRLLHNYDSLNQTGKGKLVEYSDDLKVNPKYNVTDEEKLVRIRAIARDGRVAESEFTQKEMEELEEIIKDVKSDFEF